MVRYAMLDYTFCTCVVRSSCMTSRCHFVDSGAACRMFPPVTSAQEQGSAALSKYWGVTLMGTELQQPACKSAQLATHAWIYLQAITTSNLLPRVLQTTVYTITRRTKQIYQRVIKRIGQQLALSSWHQYNCLSEL